MACFKYWCWRPLLSKLKLNIYSTCPQEVHSLKLQPKGTFISSHYIFLCYYSMMVKLNKHQISPWFFLHFSIISLGFLLSNQIKDSDLSPYSFSYPNCQDIVYFLEMNKSFLPPSHEQEQIQFLWTWTLFIWGREGLIKKTE